MYWAHLLYFRGYPHPRWNDWFGLLLRIRWTCLIPFFAVYFLLVDVLRWLCFVLVSSALFIMEVMQSFFVHVLFF